MICRYCGCEVEDDSNFCTNCGRKLTAENDVRADALQEMAKKPVKKRGKKRLFIILGAVIFVALVVGAIFLSGANGRKLQKQLDLGQRYLDESDYEQAVASYMAAIEIDPMCVKAYIGAADAYIGLEDLESAKEILEQGYEVTKDADIEEKLKDVQEEIEKIEREKEKEEEKESFGREESSELLSEEEESEEEESEEEREEESFLKRTLLKKETSYNEDGSVLYIHEYDYDEAGNKIKYTQSSDYYIDYTVYEYDEAGRLLTETDYESVEDTIEKGGWTDYSYDADGNMIKVVWHVSHASGNERYYTENISEYSYDEEGNKTSEVYYHGGSYDHTTQYIYDERNNLIEEKSNTADGFNNITTYEYDANNNLLKKMDDFYSGGGETATYEYNEEGKVITYQVREAAGDEGTVHYEYDAEGYLIREKFEDREWGIVNESQTGEKIYEYDARGDLIRESRRYDTGEEMRWDYVYTYDESERLMKAISYRNGIMDVDREYVTITLREM